MLLFKTSYIVYSLLKMFFSLVMERLIEKSLMIIYKEVDDVLTNSLLIGRLKVEQIYLPLMMTSWPVRIL